MIDFYFIYIWFDFQCVGVVFSKWTVFHWKLLISSCLRWWLFEQIYFMCSFNKSPWSIVGILGTLESFVKESFRVGMKEEKSNLGKKSLTTPKKLLLNKCPVKD